MGIVNSTTQIKTGFFHALGLVLTNVNNQIGNEQYKSAHNVRTSEIWTDEFAYVTNIEDATIESASNGSLSQVGSTVSPIVLYPLLGSAYQSYFLDTGSPSAGVDGFVPSEDWVKPLVNPSDNPNSAGAPSFGYNLVMYDPTGTEISYNSSRYDVDYFSGLIKFEENFTPIDTGAGLGTPLDDFTFEGLSVDWLTKYNYLVTNGIKATAFQYSGTFLNDYLLNLSPGGGSGGGDEWQSSVNGYLTPIGNGATVSGLTGINDQISYLDQTYEKFYVYTNDDISGVTWSGITSTFSYFEFNGATFSSYTLTTGDDANRFLLIEGDQTLDTVQISSTGSVTESPNTIVQADRIIEYTGTSSTGLTYSAWQVTDPRLGMVTTLDNKSSYLTKYVGTITGWVEYQFEVTYKVNSQRDIVAISTTSDYDIAIAETLQFEPSGDKSVDVIINGVEQPNSVFTWGFSTGASQSLTVDASGTNTITVPNSGAPTTGDYLQLNNSNDFYRQVTGTSSASATQSLITYGGETIVSITTAWKFNVVQRGGGISRQGDWLLWVGSSWHELDQTSPSDVVTLEYVTINSEARNA